MIEEGVLENVDYILGMHVWPELQEGVVGYRIGPFFAVIDNFIINIIGKGGHAT